MSFQHVLKNHDIVAGEIGSIFQDNEGFMWFGGANALLRYDGYELREMRTVADDKSAKGEPVKGVWDFHQDSKGYLWFATRWGLFKGDPKTDRIIRIPDDTTQPVSLTAQHVIDVNELPSGEIIAGSAVALFVVNQESGKYTAITPSEGKEKWLQHRRVNVSVIDEKGQIWLGTDAGIEHLDWDAKEFTMYKPDAVGPALGRANIVNAMTNAGNGKLWVGTGEGLVLYDTKNRSAKRYRHDPNDKFSLGSDDIWDLIVDSKGILWIASDKGGLTAYDEENDRFIVHKHEPGRESSISTNVIRTVFEDSTGDLWVGNYPDGVDFFDRSSAAISSYSTDPSNPNSLNHNSVLSIQEDSKGNLWLGTDGGGLNYFDRKQDTFKHFKHDPNDPTTIPSNAVLTNFIDSKGVVWVGTWGGGIASIAPGEDTFTRYPFETESRKGASKFVSDALSSPHVWGIYEDSENYLWVGTHSGGLNKFDRKTGEFTQYWGKDGDPNTIATSLVWTVLEDSKKNIWAGTTSGIELYNRENDTFKHYFHDPNNPDSLSNASVLSMFEDSKGQMWFGTDAGLNKLNLQTDTFTSYTKKDGFIDDGIRSILEDDEGNLWVSTNNGVSSFNPQTLKIKNFNRDSGKLVGGFNTGSGVKSRDGEIIFGGANGLRIFNTKELKDNKVIPPIAFTDLKIFADSVVAGGQDGILSHSINHTETIELDYTKSMFEFSFSALNYRDSGKNSYAYMLEGFDKVWLRVGSQRTAKYTNLNAGTYTFHVKGSNNDGVWNETGRKITIIQYPPPWKTWWAYTLYVVLAISIIAWLIQIQRRKRQLVEEQNRILEEKVTERTAELQQKNNDIQAMLCNMRQGLFTIEKGGVIHPEYSSYLEDIFETTEIADRVVFELMFAGSDLGGNTLDQVITAVDAIIGEDEMNFDFNEPLLVNEYEVEIGKKVKTLALDWNPIIDAEIVQKLMISVRDVTLLKQMENEAREQKRELEIIGQLLNLPSKKYLSFESSAKRFIQENRDEINARSEFEEKSVALLFRNMHTIKGNCRTFGFNHLSDVVHEVESTYSAMRSAERKSWNKAELLDDLSLVEKSLDEYADVFRRVLGRDEESASSSGSSVMESAVIQKIKSYVQVKQFEELGTYMDILDSSPIAVVLADLVDSLPSMANQLGKEHPIVNIDARGIQIKNNGHELMNDVFAHLLRNCIDHGIEVPDERMALGKNKKGRIDIRACTEKKRLRILIRDDGRGVNIEALFQKGIDMGMWNKYDTPSNQEIAELIFVSGVSTKAEVTQISGRGVGMDAVQQFLKDNGGDITLALLNDTMERLDFAPFELVFTLPSAFYLIITDGTDIIDS